MMHLGALALVLALLAAPPVADAQQAAKVPRIGLLSGTSPPTPAAPSPPLEAFRQRLRDLGWVEGQNLMIEGRWAEGKLERLPGMAAELVSLRVDCIVASTPGVILAAKKATTTIPIVMVFGADPVELGFVASLARPGGNITGLASLSAELNPKQLQLLKEAVPKLTQVVVLRNPANPWHAVGSKELDAAAFSLGVSLQFLEVRGPDEFDTAFATMTRKGTGAVFVLSDPMFFVHRTRLAHLAVKHRLPTMHGVIEFAVAGDFMAYYPNSVDLFRRAATYVDNILKGAKPADLPVEQPMRFELVVNLKTAKALGLTIPPSVLLRADEVIKQ
jgi:putative ABC transport system substrate-binding protein